MWLALLVSSGVVDADKDSSFDDEEEDSNELDDAMRQLRHSERTFRTLDEATRHPAHAPHPHPQPGMDTPRLQPETASTGHVQVATGQMAPGGAMLLAAFVLALLLEWAWHRRRKPEIVDGSRAEATTAARCCGAAVPADDDSEVRAILSTCCQTSY